MFWVHSYVVRQNNQTDKRTERRWSRVDSPSSLCFSKRSRRQSGPWQAEKRSWLISQLAPGPCDSEICLHYLSPGLIGHVDLRKTGCWKSQCDICVCLARAHRPLGLPDCSFWHFQNTFPLPSPSIRGSLSCSFQKPVMAVCKAHLSVYCG